MEHSQSGPNVQELREIFSPRKGHRPQRRGTIAFDFDGVLSKGAEYSPVLEALDVEGILRAQAAGYSVAVMTCAPLGHVGRALESAGFDVCVDHGMRYAGWRSLSTVLVTGRKVVAEAYIDDRAVRHSFGDDWSTTLAAAGVRS